MTTESLVSFSVPAANTTLVQDILNLINGSEPQGRETTVNESSAKQTTKKTSATKKETAPAKKESTDDFMDYEEFKEAAKKAKAEHGEEFVISVMEDSGVKKKASLGTTVKSVPEKSRALIAKLWAMGEEELADDEADEDLDEDDFGDEEDDAEVTAEAVQLALKAYAKENDKAAAKEIMAKYKVKVLADVEKLDDKKLAALMKELV